MSSRCALGLLAAGALASCFKVDLPGGDDLPNGDTIGDLGKVELTYDGPADDSCMFGCGLQMPLMAGDSEGIAVGSHSTKSGVALPPFTFRSGDPSVFDVAPTLDDGAFPSQRSTTLQGHRPGSATLTMSDADTGEVVDTTTVTVAPAASMLLSFTLGGAQVDQPPGTQLVLGVGGQAVLIAHVRDAAGRDLAGWNGVSAEIADADVATVERSSQIVLVGETKGTTTLTVTAGAVTQAIPLRVE